MDAQLEVKLIECLDALAQGESVERILARYPQEAAQLRPLLQTAAGLPALRMEPSEAVKIRSRQKFMAQADMLRRTPTRKSMGFLPRFATGFVAAGLVAIVLSTGAVAASGSALPGDPLYNVKRTVENVRLSTAGSPVVRDELQREFEQRRRDEANELLDAGREGEVEFTGLIESIQPDAWIVGGLAIEIDANTSIVGTPQINRLAEVHGMTGPNGLRASSITIESAGETDKTPETKETATPEVHESTETPRPSATPEPTITDAPAGTPTATPRPAASPRPTATPQPTATTEPVEVEFTGGVQAIEADTWNIDGTTIGVNANTEIRGSINVGQRVKVKALRQGNGQLIAIRIEPIDDSGSGSDSGGGASNQNDNPTPEPNDNRNENGNENQNRNDNEGNSNDGNSNENENDNQNSNDGGSPENDNRNENDNSSNGN
jgi:hypothetical protein